MSKECCVKYVALYWKTIVAVLIPILLLPVFLIHNTPATRCLYVVIITIVFYIIEPIPLPVTALIPIGMFPLLQVEDTATVCKMYMHETTVLFLATLIIASSIEVCNLHKRIALNVLHHVKCSHRRLHLGLMLVSMFISMWLPNFAVVAIMSPICVAFLEELEIQGITTVFERSTSQDMIDNRRPTRTTICYFLGIAYAANLGGCGSLIGTHTNLVLKRIYESYYPNDIRVDFIRFIAYGSPIMLLNTLLTWLWMQFFYMGMFRPKSRDAAATIVREEDARAAKKTMIINYASMGKITAAEIQVSILLVLLVFVWLFRTAYFTTEHVKTKSVSMIKNASPTIIFIIFFFMLPSKWNFLDFCRKKTDNPERNSQSLLTWTYVHQKIPWGTFFIFGAGIAIAECGKTSGMNAMVGENLFSFRRTEPLAILFIVCLMCQILTELSANEAIANIILPNLRELSTRINVHPIYLMFPAALTLSMAFHLPASTPANEFVFHIVNIPKKQMFYCGIGPSIITLFTYWSSFPTYGSLFYKLDKLPEWTNTTISSECTHNFSTAL